MIRSTSQQWRLLRGFAQAATVRRAPLLSSHHHHHSCNNKNSNKRSHYSYSGPGSFDHQHDHTQPRDYKQRGFTVGIGGPVGSGKTALVLQLCRALHNNNNEYNLGVVTNDIFTQEDAEFLTKHDALPAHRIRAVETGGCPHAAIREDVSSNLTALEELSNSGNNDANNAVSLLLCESGGDNLAANFSRELADLTLYVIDVAGGDKVPRKGGPGITQSDLLVINKIDLADAVGADLNVMVRDANRMRSTSRGTATSSNDGSSSSSSTTGPTLLAAVKHGRGVPEICDFILKRYHAALAESASS